MGDGKPVVLTSRERVCLSDAVLMGGTYFWKPATCKQLAAKGLMEAGTSDGMACHRLTEAGIAAHRAALAAGRENGNG